MERSDQIIEELLQDVQPAPRRGFSVGSVVLIIGFVLMVAVIGMQLARQNQTQPTSGPAPDFSLTTFDGDTFRLSEQRGKVVSGLVWQLHRPSYMRTVVRLRLPVRSILARPSPLLCPRQHFT